MKGLGERLRTRARQLGWSDSEVARRAGLVQTRYANYVIDKHEPDLTTLLRICAVLEMPVGEVLGQSASVPRDEAELRARIDAALTLLDGESLKTVATVLEGLVARQNAALRAT
ncbi:transcriptional regulator with XRE-family HTH domain [Endobacter medicaginis]|uniref:Transcriptional regulator with XRE-family HTH domain n=1 Tax=Endobacter medicaginis TaxID=1181271 RepID=A0A839UWX0_9PROT|nr:helix-turn-helix transcriptional regulator [Endobacter medicaginis]MBB3172873.1 transcriptional regulator with XRE-family HTH domain [Endobacter medicaginis]MCX5474798.1 helix-turn-helix transcriptional regulator [Endobacter medicaginis]